MLYVSFVRKWLQTTQPTYALFFFLFSSDPGCIPTCKLTPAKSLIASVSCCSRLLHQSHQMSDIGVVYISSSLLLQLALPHSQQLTASLAPSLTSSLAPSLTASLATILATTASHHSLPLHASLVHCICDSFTASIIRFMHL